MVSSALRSKLPVLESLDYERLSVIARGPNHYFRLEGESVFAIAIIDKSIAAEAIEYFESLYYRLSNAKMDAQEEYRLNYENGREADSRSRGW